MSDELDRPHAGLSRLRDLGKQWANFLSVVLSPDVLVLTGTASALVLIDIKLPASPSEASASGVLLRAILTIGIAVASGLVGARLAHRLEELSGRSVLVTRGKSAIRGLKLLNLNVRSLEMRTRALGLKVGATSDSAGQAFEELAGRCDTLEEEVLNAIEEWQDIIPEADLSTQVGLITQLKTQQIGLIEDAAALRNELEETHDRSVQEKTRLETALAEKETQLQKVNRELRSKELKLSSAVGSVGSAYGTVLGDPTNAITGMLREVTSKKCDSCGNYWPGVIAGTCPYCFGVGR